MLGENYRMCIRSSFIGNFRKVHLRRISKLGHNIVFHSYNKIRISNTMFCTNILQNYVSFLYFLQNLQFIVNYLRGNKYFRRICVMFRVGLQLLTTRYKLFAAYI